MQRKTGLFVILLMLFSIPALSQEEAIIRENEKADSLLRIFLHQLEDPVQQGHIEYKQDPRVTRILRKHHEFHKGKPVKGWKVLIYKGREQEEAFNHQAEFMDVYSDMDIPVSVRYNEPDFFTMVGAFRTKEQAFRLQSLIKSRYPSAYLVAENLQLNELK